MKERKKFFLTSQTKTSNPFWPLNHLSMYLGLDSSTAETKQKFFTPCPPTFAKNCRITTNEERDDLTVGGPESITISYQPGDTKFLTYISRNNGMILSR